ncbi:Uncharacterised protein [Streptococcus pneumoniae]|nr:Uncharacterised protein [Streptococcus pneumoniae]
MLRGRVLLISERDRGHERRHEPCRIGGRSCYSGHRKNAFGLAQPSEQAPRVAVGAAGGLFSCPEGTGSVVGRGVAAGCGLPRDPEQGADLFPGPPCVVELAGGCGDLSLCLVDLARGREDAGVSGRGLEQWGRLECGAHG